MHTENIIIANLRCNGCMTTITKKLTAIAGVQEVNINLENSEVSVKHDETVSRAQLTTTLLSLGYPEATEKNGLLTQIKSLSSCITGKFDSN